MRADCERVVFEEQRASACKGIIPGTLEVSLWMRGFERFFMDLVLDPGLAGAILDKALEIKLRYWETVFGHIGDILDVVYDADDYGSQTAPLIAPDLWRKMVKPRISELYAFVHANSRAKVFLHSDGAIRSLIPDLIEAGVDALNPVQFTAEGMDIVELKREFGREIAFWGGGVDTQKVLPWGTPQEVRDQVRRNVEPADAGRWLHLRHGAQRPGRCPAREPRGHGRGPPRGGRLPLAGAAAYVLSEPRPRRGRPSSRR